MIGESEHLEFLIHSNHFVSSNVPDSVKFPEICASFSDVDNLSFLDTEIHDLVVGENGDDVYPADSFPRVDSKFTVFATFYV